MIMQSLEKIQRKVNRKAIIQMKNMLYLILKKQDLTEIQGEIAGFSLNSA
jgi:hypothetical protein